MRLVRLRPYGLMAALSVATAAAQQTAPAAEEVLARLDTYLETYESALGALVADERLVQYVGRPTDGEKATLGINSGVNAIRVTREIHSEVAFIDLPGHAGWLGVRDVRTVSGKNVRAPGPSLSATLSEGGLNDFRRARALLLAGARHNLGEARTTNLPTVPLEFLSLRHRWRYDVRIEGDDRVEGRRTARVVLDERSTPTLVRRGDGGNLMARVVGWVEPESGRLWRAEVRFEDPRLVFAGRDHPTRIRVHFKLNEQLELVVPDSMEEWFYDSVRGDGFGEARYRNYRRFDAARPPVPR